MKINVTENKVSIKEEQILNENEYNIHKIQFDFSSEYTDDLVKVALFSIDNHTYKKIISNNECDIPPEVLTQRGYSILGVYAYKTEQDTLVLRYSPSPTKISVYDGSYKADAENSEPITPSEIEQYQQILQNSLQQFQNQYNALVEETEGDIQAIEDELQRKVDEGYFDGEDGFSPIAKVIQKSNGATIEIEDKNGKTTADVLNGEDGYTPVRGIDYWTEEDKQEVEEEATQQIEGKIEEYNENAAEKLNQYNQNSVQKTNDYNTNATEKTSTYNSNATEKFNDYNSNAEQKETNYNTNASQKVESFNTNASSKLSEYNSNAETKKTAYDENATQKTNSFNTNATNKLTEYNTNHTEKMSTYNNNSTQKLNAFNENATQKTEDFDAHTEKIQDNIEALQTENERLKATLPTTGEVTGQAITLNKTAELEFKKPPLPMGNSEQDSTEGYQLLPRATKLNENVTDTITISGITFKNLGGGHFNITGTATETANCAIFNAIAEPLIVEAGDYCLSAQSLPSGVKIITSGSGNNGFSYKELSSSTLSAVSTVIDGTKPFNYIVIRVASGTTVNNDIYFALEEGTTAHNWEKYTGGTASPNPDYPQEITNVTGDVEVVVENKNLILTSDWINATINADGTYTNASSRLSSTYIKINPEKTNLIFSFNTESLFFGIAFYDKNKNFLSRTVTNSNTKLTSTIPSNALYARTLISFTGATLDGNSFAEYEMQLEYSSTATPYTPHKEQVLPLTLGNIELCKIGDYQDYFYKQSNKWYLHKEINKIVLDGSESGWSITTRSDGTTKFFARTYVNEILTNNTSASNELSNYFTVGNPYISIEDKIWLFKQGNNTTLRIGFKDQETITTVSEFKEWLSTHNTELYYPLATPTDTEITDTTLISQLEAINNALSYEEQTNISSNTIALFNVEAYQSTKLVLEERDAKYESLEARVALLE